jgi:hypothetical protein
LHSRDPWAPKGYIPLRDEINQRGREDFGSEWPEPPTEEDYKREVLSRQRAVAALEAEASSHAIVEADPENWAASFKLPSLSEASGFSTVALMRRKSIIDDLDRGYEEKLLALSADIVGKLRIELNDGKREAFRKTPSGDLEPIDLEWWASDAARRLLSDWQKSGDEILLKAKVEVAAEAKRVAGTDVKECETWFVEERKRSPMWQPKSKTEYLQEARVKWPKLSEAAVKRAWNAAVEEQLADGWNKSGRRKSLNQ